MTVSVSMIINPSVVNLQSKLNRTLGVIYAGASALTACLVTVVLSRLFKEGMGAGGGGVRS
jgi:hypothetical protein